MAVEMWKVRHISIRYGGGRVYLLRVIAFPKGLNSVIHLAPRYYSGRSCDDAQNHGYIRQSTDQGWQ